MRFVRLRIAGFKTFVEPTEVPIEPGLTGVVGPNGCGKSNLVEAMRWVMGENSSRNMRATDMDDVIFSGSTRRPARNRAEVTLVLDNTDRTAPQAFNEADFLEVSRRIERGAGSSYRINGRDVRARDVQLLFADASTGSRSPSMVRQGQIGELIAAKPSARRRILEEAAGVSGLHSRRHEAELRLKAAEQNLSRLEDVLGEIGSQLESLRRQARQAARYRALSGEIRRGEATRFYLKWIAARAQVSEIGETLEKAAAGADAAARAQADAARDHAVAAAAVPGLRDREAAAGAALTRLQAAAEALAGEERRARERLTELERRIAQLAEDIVREQRLAAEAEVAAQTLSDEAESLAAEEEQAGGRGEDIHALLQEARATLQDAEARHGAATRAGAEIAARRAALEREAHQTARRLGELERELATLERERAEAEARLAAESGPAMARIAVEEAEEAVIAAEDMASVADAELQSARQDEAAARGPAAEAEAALQRLETEAATLTAILSAGSGEGFAPLLDSLTVAPGFEAALAAALGSDLEAPVEPAAATHWAGAEMGASDPALPNAVEPLSRHVGAPLQLARRLAQIGIVAREDGARLRPLLAVGQRLVSPAGDLWRWDGFTASAEAPGAAAQRLAQRNRLAELEAGRPAAVAARDADRQHLSAAQTAVARVTAAEKQARDAVRERQRLVLIAQETLARADRAAGELERRRATLADLAMRRATDAEHAHLACEEVAIALDDLPPAGAYEDDLAALAEAVARARARLAELTAEEATASREREMRVRRLGVIARDREAAALRIRDAGRRAEELAGRREELEDERIVLLDAPDDHALRRRNLEREIATADAARLAAAEARTTGERILAEADRAAREALAALSAAREGRARAEERLSAARDRRTETERQIGETLGCAPLELAGIAGLDAAAPLPDPAGIEARLERLKAERERLGGVNLRAEDEANEVEARRDGLVADRDDLTEAIRRLRQGITTLNGEARDRLLKAFAIVDGHFRQLFTHLFNGGTAELALVDSEDPLEAGLEIIARPPGKKPQTLTLLSGGEQALTTMALIFAVFLTNPAPICVLDEVDAPLDDANVERFCDLVVEMTRRTDTRFLVITHNPITMARTQRLFGVTMVERGVSQVVSVDLQTAETFRDAG